MKKVMLIGDSIRMMTEERVREMLGNEYDVWSPEDNCRYTAITLNELRNYFTHCPDPEIIHWNNGLWDTAIVYDDDGNFTPLDVYVENLRRILKQLKKTGAKIIFATTTPTHPKKEIRYSPTLACHFNSDIEKYNEKAVELMKSEGVIINDLFPILKRDIDRYIRQDDMIHPTDDGIEVISEQIVAKILEVEGSKQ